MGITSKELAALKRLAVCADMTRRTAKDILEPPINPELKNALENAVPHMRELNTRVLGNWLKKNKGRIIDKKQLVGRMDTHTKIMLWRVKTC